ncbi:hypothetical protein [Candidatus Poriferisodalis sp.]|uniref:hypothetical protein n=1 Tax=Candidatus Poriferisodalis sp. TaxID=3101277 RepID=UPI003B0107AF
MGAVPWLERSDADGDGAEELGVEWNSLAAEAGAAAASGAPGLSCPDGMVLDDGLCKTPKTETVPVTQVCPQAGDGYVPVSDIGEHGESHSCQKTVPAHCVGGKVLHEGKCRTATVEHEPATWVCTAGTPVTSSGDHGVARNCEIALDTPTCSGKQIYRTSPREGCYVRNVSYETKPHRHRCPPGYAQGHDGMAATCTMTVSPPQCPAEQTYRTSPSRGCYEQEDYYRTKPYRYRCPSGYSQSHDGFAATCVKTVPPYCAGGETYRTSPRRGCYEQEDYYRTKPYRYRCPSGYSQGHDGFAATCVKTVSPYCAGGETYRTSPSRGCYEPRDYYRTRGYEWTCSQGTRVTASGDHGVSYSCRIAVSPPTCPSGQTYRTSPAAGCYNKESYRNSRPYRYSCPATYTLQTSGIAWSCTKTETYRKRVCAFDPIAGQQCWYENRTRTLTKAATRTCPSGYSPDGTGCTADTASTRWKRTRSTPTKHRYEAAAKSCPSGYSDNGALCRSDTASQRWNKTTRQPITTLTRPAVPYCDTGFSDNGSLCQSDAASQRWNKTTRQPITTLTRPAVPYCDSGYTDNGAVCQSDTASQRWNKTTGQPITTLTRPAVPYCDSGYTDNGAVCRSDVATVTWDRTDRAPAKHRYEPAKPRCATAGFEYSATATRCEKTAYTDPTEPRTKHVGRPPVPTCPHGYDAAGAGRCERTVLGDPTRVPDGAECIDHLGTLGAGTVTRSGTLVAGTVTPSGKRASGCASLRRGDAQSPHWARRYSLYVSAASTATVTASSAAADVFVYVLSGTDASLVVEGSDDDSGPGTDAEASGVALEAGVLYTIEVTTSADRVTGAFTLAVTTALGEPPVAISGLADAEATGRGTLTAADKFTVEPADAACTATAAGVTPSVAKTATPAERTVSVTLTAPFSHEVTVACDAPRRTATSVRVTLTGRLPEVSVTGLDDSVPVGSASYALDTFTVNPATARCTATAAGRGAGTPWVSSLSATRTVLVRLGPGGAAEVTVTCTAAGYSPGTAKAVFSAEPRPQIGTVAAKFAPADACTTTAAAQHADAAHSCTLAQGSTLTVTLTSTADHATIATSWDTTGGVAATPGKARAATPVIGPDNAATGDWQATHTATLACTAHGAATATVTAGRHPADDTHTTRIGIDCRQQVRISGLDDATGYSTTGAKATVSDAFTVEPATAHCTAAPTGTVTAPDPRRPKERLLSAQITAGTTTTVTVTCTNNDRADGTAEVDLTAAVPRVTSVAVTADSGGSCAVSSAPLPAGADAAYRCTATRGADLVVSVAADANTNGPSLGWDASGAVRVVRSAQDRRAVPLIAPGGSLSGWRRTGTATLSCAAGGAATVTTALPGAADYVTRVDVSCGQRVRIGDLDDTAAAGTATAAVSDTFAVTPAAARCTATATTGTPVVSAGVGGVRAVRLDVRVGASAVVTVTCTHSGHDPATATATFAATPAGGCGDPLGTLGVGSVTRSGTIAADAACISPQRVRDGGDAKRYWARRHTFTLAAPAKVTVDAGSPTRRGLDAYVVLLEGHSSDGTGTVAGRDNNSGPRRDARLAALALPAGDYTVEVTTAGKRRTGNYRLQVTTAAAPTACTDDLGTLAAGRYTRTGTITDACVSTRRGTPTARPGARWHTFTLAAPAWVDIDLAAAAASPLDPYLALIGADNGTPTVIEQDDNSGTGNTAQIQGRYLEAGTYTVEVTAAAATGTTAAGDYTLTVTVPIHGLAQSYDATVDEQTTINFTYWPTNARIDAQSAELLTEPAGRNGKGSVTATPTVVKQHSVSVLLTTSSAANGETSSRYYQRSSSPSATSTRVFPSGLGAGCPDGKVLSEVNGILCVNPRTQPLPAKLHEVVPDPSSGVKYRGPYLVTPGALRGISHASARALNPYGTTCGITVHELTALLLGIGFREIPNKVWVDTNENGDDDGPVDDNGKEFERENARYDARSLMTLSRKDHKWTPVGAGEDNSRLYSNDSLTDGPSRAFWHPGVGMWQIDKFSSTDLNHGQRASTRFGALRVAQVLLNAYCGPSSAPLPEPSLKELTNLMSKQWHACRHLGEENLCWITKKNLMLHNDDLFVRVSANADDDSTIGGALARNCRWNTQDGRSPTAPLACYFYDTAHPEGAVHNSLPYGHKSKAAREDWMDKSSPYAAPFVSLNYQKGRFAVFPKSLLPGSTKTLIKRVPLNPRPGRDATTEKMFQVRRITHTTWHENDHFDGLQLEMLICIRRARSYFPLCDWVSVNADSGSVGGSFGTRIAPQRGR